MASNGNDRGSEHDPLSQEEREALRRRASDLGRRLEEVHARKAPPVEDAKSRGNALGQAYKILIELVVGVVIGAGLGWFFDKQFGTQPWLMVLMLIVGFAAGMANVVRVAKRMQAAAEPLQRAASSAPVDLDDDDDDPPSADGRAKPSGRRPD